MILQVLLAFDSGLDRIKLSLSHFQTFSAGLDVPCLSYQNHLFYSVEINTHMLKSMGYNHKLPTALTFSNTFLQMEAKKQSFPKKQIAFY